MRGTFFCFAWLLFVSFNLSTLTYVSMASMGYMMFGHETLLQITLNLPGGKISFIIAIYTAVIYTHNHAGCGSHEEELVQPLWHWIHLHSAKDFVADQYSHNGPPLHVLRVTSGSGRGSSYVTISILLPCTSYLKVSGSGESRLPLYLGLSFSGYWFKLLVLICLSRRLQVIFDLFEH